MARTVAQTTALGASAVVTLPATSGVSHGILSIVASYNGLITNAGNLQVSVGGTVVFNIDFPNGGPFVFEEDISGEPGQAIVVTLTGFVAGLIGKLNVNSVSNM